MANLGSNDTAVEGLDFSLPAGAQLDEESGDLVIRDSGGSVVFRRDEAAGEWVSDSLNTNKATINHGAVRGRNSERIDASKFDGADADARLDNALSAASNGDKILLENANYTESRSISTELIIKGIGGAFSANGTTVTGSWAIDATSRLIGVNNEGSITLNSDFTTYECANKGGSATITVNASRCRISEVAGGEVIFESGTTTGLIDGCVEVTVTDNGTNTVGDIA